MSRDREKEGRVGAGKTAGRGHLRGYGLCEKYRGSSEMLKRDALRFPLRTGESQPAEGWEQSKQIICLVRAAESDLCVC